MSSTIDTPPGTGTAPQIQDAAAPSPTRPKPNWFRRVVMTLAFAYVGWIILALFAQDFVIYLGAYRGSPTTDGPSDPAVTQLWLEPAEGVRVEGWFMPGEGRTATNPGPAVLVLHGNKHWIDDIWRFHSAYTKAGYSFLAVDYRGYGRSRGTPSAAALISDAKAWMKRLRERPEVDPDQIVVHANSLGGALAIEVAAEYPVRILILESTFYRLEELFGRLLLPQFICRTSFRSHELLSEVRAPVLVIHGRNDWLIPISHGERLADAAAIAEFIDNDSGHTNYEPDWPAIRGFLGAGRLPEPQ
jgi:pimeloyl-ACP methyl ester carboxylesterase